MQEERFLGCLAWIGDCVIPETLPTLFRRGPLLDIVTALRNRVDSGLPEPRFCIRRYLDNEGDFGVGLFHTRGDGWVTPELIRCFIHNLLHPSSFILRSPRSKMSGGTVVQHLTRSIITFYGKVFTLSFMYKDPLRKGWDCHLLLYHVIDLD